MCSLTYMFQQVLLRDARLKEVPKKLCATGKDDVGLVKHCPPVHIIPYSDYRPRKAQLKPESITGITPVFNLLLKASLIVLCKTLVSRPRSTP